MTELQVKKLCTFKSENIHTFLCFPVVMIVFDFDDISPLQNIVKWKQMVDEKTEEAFFFLVGSKRDIVVITLNYTVFDCCLQLAVLSFGCFPAEKIDFGLHNWWKHEVGNKENGHGHERPSKNGGNISLF